MSGADPLRVLLDESTPDPIGRAFSRHNHIVIYHREVLAPGVPDAVVCAAALANDAILVAVDADMKRLAHRYGTAPGSARFDRLHLIRIGCSGVLAAKRTEQAMSLLVHEWEFTRLKVARRLWVEIGPHFIRTFR